MKNSQKNRYCNIKLLKGVCDEIDKIVAKDGFYGNRSDFVSQIIREKIKEIKKR